MITNLRPAMMGATALLALGLTACGGGTQDAADATANTAGTATAGVGGPRTGATAAAAGNAPTLADGPDVCFREIAKKLGPDTKINEVTSYFSKGKDLDRMGMTRRPQGELTTCIVTYQSPQDPRKLVKMNLDPATRTFGEQQPVEISVMGGNPSEFRLDDFLIPLSQVNSGAIKALMDAQKPELDKAYSSYAWSGLRLVSPGLGDDRHRLRMDLDGRLASNDVLDSGYAEVSTDGKQITSNHLID